MTQAQVIARLAPTPGRRGLAVAILYGLGGLLVALGLLHPTLPAFRVVLVVLGAGTLLLGEKLRRATALALELTEAGLRDSTGRMLAPMAQIRQIDRGIFAFKPSNGFLVTLDRPVERAWAPGLYWCLGRRIGVGGVVSSGPARAMAEQIAARIAAP
ncbi:MAG: hypothetical protein HLUCCA08_11740 [Rhodobacteraceae bacterium HLUCCA08]|nr:MAG: hypothetical protein HLUCCA08_11740 [Rhodobacteraceae bacterium HLUCCA08]